MNKDDMTRQCIVQWRGVEEHMENCEHDLVVQWHLLVHVVC